MKIRVELDDEAKQMLKDFGPKMVEILDQQILSQGAEIDAETHLIVAGLIEDSCRAYVERAWLQQVRERLNKDASES